jgi:hypothetical protein
MPSPSQEHDAHQKVSQWDVGNRFTYDMESLETP